MIVEHASAAPTLHARAGGDTEWTASALTAADTLSLPEVGVEVPVAEFFVGTDLADC